MKEWATNAIGAKVWHILDSTQIAAGFKEKIARSRNICWPYSDRRAFSRSSDLLSCRTVFDRWLNTQRFSDSEQQSIMSNIPFSATTVPQLQKWINMAVWIISWDSVAHTCRVRSWIIWQVEANMAVIRMFQVSRVLWKQFLYYLLLKYALD